MSKVRADNYSNRLGTGAPDFPDGLNVTGTAATFSGNVSIAGTLTYQDVESIDSIGIITAQQGIQVLANGLDITGFSTFKTGVSVTGVVTATSFSGSGANLTGVEFGVNNFVANGAIPNGSTVVINTDGTVGVITSSGAPTDSVGVKTTFTANASNTRATFDSTNGKVVIAYEDGGNSSYSTAIVGTVTGTGITFGSAVVFESATSYPNSLAFDSTNGKVVIVYRDVGNSSAGTAVVGTVSGDSISFGTPVAFNASYTNDMSIAFDSGNGKMVIAYRDQGGNSSYGTAVVGTVSGTSISFGTPVVFESAATSQCAAVYDSANGKVVIGYRDDGNSYYGTAVVGTVSGTSISFGTPVVFNAGQVEHVAATFDSTAGVNKVVIAYRDDANSDYGTAIVGTVSGTSISFGDEVVYNSSNSTETGITHDSTNGKVVIVYKDGTPGTASVFTTNGVVTNLTSQNYIGIAAAGISSGATGKITIAGGINSGQTGLTTARTYYVQNSGGISTVASSPSVVAGTSISDTEILIR